MVFDSVILPGIYPKEKSKTLTIVYFEKKKYLIAPKQKNVVSLD